MSVVEVDKKIESLWKEAESMQASLSRLIAEVHADTKLSEEGKQEEIDALTEGHRAKLTDMRDAEKQLVDTAILDLERKIDSRTGNTASDIIAFRDAQDRAERLESAEDAERLMKRAIVTEDDSLAHAVFRRSLEHGYRSPVDAFTKARPELAEVASDLSALTSFRNKSFERAVRYAVTV